MLAILALVSGLPRLRESKTARFLTPAVCNSSRVGSMDNISCTSIIGLP